MLSTDYHEIDPSPLATQAIRWLAETEKAEKPAAKFRAYCEEFPWAVECKLYED